MERYKLLYEISRKALDEELDRYKRLDEKASRFLSIMSISIVGFTALVNAASHRACALSSSEPAEWAFLLLSALTVLTFFSAWLRIFSSIKLAESPRVNIDDTVNELTDEEELITIYNVLALACQDAVAKARTNLAIKTEFLESAYKEIRFSTYLLLASLVLYFWIPPATIGIAP